MSDPVSPPVAGATVGSDGTDRLPSVVPSHPDGDGTRIAGTLVVAPTTGVFRLGVDTSPDGRVVRPGDRIGHVEASGSLQPVEALSSGRLVRLLASEGERVRTGQRLAWLDPAGTGTGGAGA